MCERSNLVNVDDKVTPLARFIVSAPNDDLVSRA
jgi:hypothetical protein